MEKRVWIIGASSGIGLDLVKLWLQNNYQVIASSRDIENSNELLKLKLTSNILHKNPFLYIIYHKKYI